MRKITSIAIAVLLVAPAVMAEGEVYRWKDSNNLWHYSDQPQPGAELVKKSGNRSSSANSSSSQSTPAAVSSEGSGAPSLSREVTQQVRQEVATTKAEQCKKATEAYQKSITARRLYKEDAKGNRVFLSSAEIDAARLEARSTRDITCSPNSP